MNNQRRLQDLFATLMSSQLNLESSQVKPQIDKEFVEKLFSSAHSLLRDRQPIVCPQCGSSHYWRNGRYRKYYYRYKCVHCGKKFSDLTGTPMYYIHKLPELLQFLKSYFSEGVSVRKTGAMLKVDKNTVLRWRHKFGLALSEAMSVQSTSKVFEVYHYLQRISLKGSRHREGQKYDDKFRKVVSLKGVSEITTLLISDREGETSAQIFMMEKKNSISSLVEAVVSKTKRSTKLLFNSDEEDMFHCFRKLLQKHRKYLLTETEWDNCVARNQWKNFNEIKLYLNVYQNWAWKFRGVATKYQQLYYDIFRFGIKVSKSNSPMENLLMSILKCRDNTLKYKFLSRLVIEI